VVEGGSPAPYRFDELGRFQFELLCQELLRRSSGASIAEWRAVRRGTALAIPDGVDVPGGRRLEGPALVVAAWRRAVGEKDSVFVTIRQARELWRRLTFRSLLVLATVRTSTTRPDDLDAVWLGPEELSALVADSWELRLRCPAVLGVGAAEDLVAGDAADRSTSDVASAKELARVFVSTRAYAAAVDALTHRHFTVLTGPPEVGKTAIARMVGLAALTDGWEVHECIRPEELWGQFQRDRRQVFIADDAFGSTEYRPDAAERWALEPDRVLRAMDDRHWLVWTSRPAPLKAGLRRLHREHGVERFPQPAEVQVDAAELDIREKALILFRHARAAELPAQAIELVRAEGWAIVSHPHFTPERIRRFVDGHLLDLTDRVRRASDLDAIVEAEIREPTDAMAASFRALFEEHRMVLLALLDTPPGPVPERELAAAYRRHAGSGLGRSMRDVVDRLTDHFLRVDDSGAVTWVHPSWRDLVIEQLVEDAPRRQRFLRECSIDGLLLAVSIAGGASGELELPLLQEDADWDALSDRVAGAMSELEHPDLTRWFVALAEARLDAEPEGELQALVRYSLELVSRRWREECEVVPVGLLASWFDIAATASLTEPIERPDIVATWVELLPGDRVDPRVASDVVRFDEWLALVQLLQERAPEALATVGFPERYRSVVGRLVDDVHRMLRTGEALEHRDLLAGALMRVQVLPEHFGRAAWAATTLWMLDDVSQLPVLFTPRQLSPELQGILDAPPTLVPSDEALVARVLEDL
jgi:hypothetical protein